MSSSLSSQDEYGIQDLFDEVLLKIFLVADMNLSDIFTCTIVCKKWSEIMSENELWRYLCLRDFGEKHLGESDCKTLYLVSVFQFEEEQRLREEEERRLAEEERQRLDTRYNYYGNYAAFVGEKDEVHLCDKSYASYDESVYSAVDSNEYVFDYDEVEKEDIVRVLKEKGVVLLKGFVSDEDCDKLSVCTDMIANECYTDENLADHSAYPMDDQGSRVSWAFALPGVEKNNLPCINMKHSSGLFDSVTDTVKDIMNVKRGRTLFNIQKYSDSCPSIRPHHDGEVVRVSKRNGRLYETQALFPQYVSLLTLKNETMQGTRIHIDMEPGIHEVSWRKVQTTKTHQKIVFCAQKGDLLIFDNIRNEHSVEELKSTSKDQVIRHIIGWRAMEDDCYWMNTDRPYGETFYEPVSFEKAKYYQMKNIKSKFTLRE
eukprot:TRINITY_DN2427_c0_g1_i1.p1 TRINITY_DN2427_c0_g1~~TRINITY_DN2427_c0_g1_i1.p1  ORF type:complete len:429 (-),score=84.86 TRINITY_DN2427_c0_g1_i1:610-1896(-)